MLGVMKWRLLLWCMGICPNPKGRGFSMERFNFLTSNASEDYAGTDFARQNMIGEHVKTLFRPADVTVGPDGAVYVADWFDACVGNHETLGQEGSGTIYRIAPKGFKPQIPKLNLATVEGPIEVLKNPSPNVRALGFYALVKSGAPASVGVADRRESVYPGPCRMGPVAIGT